MQSRFDPASVDPDVFFFDDFESGDLQKWDACDPYHSGERPALTRDTKHVHSGRHALDLTARPGPSAGAKVVKWFLPGLDTVYARWYCLFPFGFDPGRRSSFFSFCGGPAHDPYASWKSCTRPNGRDFFRTSLVPTHQQHQALGLGILSFYTYYPDMTPDAHGQHWGNLFLSEPPFLLLRDHWYCMEAMVKCNAPERTTANKRCG